VLVRMHRKRLATYASLGFAADATMPEFTWPTRRV
jgi:hypothetical protein